MALAIGIDIGGTKIAAGVVDEAGHISAKMVAHASDTTLEGIERVVGETVAQLRTQFEVETVGIGLAGFIDSQGERVLSTPNLSLHNAPLRSRLQGKLKLPVVLDNDANAMAWAEYRYGAGMGISALMCVTVGTGLGGGIVLDGRLYRGGFGAAGEPGHMNVVRDGLLCGCGKRGCWEQYASGRALMREARHLASLSPAAQAQLEKSAGTDIASLTGPHLTQAARDGNEIALECFALAGDWLGRGLANLAEILDPERFVIGGGVIEAAELILEPAIASFKANLASADIRPVAQIVAAEFANDSGIIGAADLARTANI